MDRASSSAYVTPLVAADERQGAGRGVGLRLEGLVNRGARGIGALVAFQAWSVLVRSAADWSTTSDTRVSGAAASVSSIRTSCADHRDTVVASNSSVAYSSDPTKPVSPRAIESVQVELRRRRRLRHRLEAKAVHVELRHRRVLEDEHHLEERGAGQVARRAQLLDELVEGYVLMPVRAERRLPRSTHELAQRRLSAHIDAKGQRVDEEADQVLQLGALSPRHRSAHHHVALPRHPAKPRREPPREAP